MNTLMTQDKGPSDKLKRIIFLIGPTGAGKSTLIDHLVSNHNYHAVQVGKMMRAKYPPSHFEGSAAPAKTQDEAWQMMTDGIKNSTKQFIVVDGQPRNVDQCNRIINTYSGGACFFRFIHLYASFEARDKRLKARDDGNAYLDLAFKRLTGPSRDEIELYNVISTLNLRGYNADPVDTTAFRVEQIVDRLML